MADDSSERVGYFSHAVSKSVLKPGDHIYVHRTGGLYDHHGIYIGKEGCEVIHFSGTRKSDARIESCTVEEFCKGSQLRLVSYNQAHLLHVVKRRGSSHSTQSDPVEDVIKRAEYYLSNPDEWENYHLLFNNCESFAVYCKTEQKVSRQVSGNDVVGEVTEADGLIAMARANDFMYVPTGI